MTCFEEMAEIRMRDTGRIITDKKFKTRWLDHLNKKRDKYDKILFKDIEHIIEIENKKYAVLKD